MRYTINATLTKTYEITVDAESSYSALELIDDWIADDFDDYETGARWDMVAS